MEQNKDAKHCKTFGDVCGEWLQFKESKLKISSYTRYEVIIDRHILPQFGDVKVDEYSCHLFEDGLKAIMDIDGIRLSRSTMNTVLYIVRAVIKYGSRHGYNKELEIEFECSDMGKVSSIQVLSNEEELRLISYLDSDRKNPNHMGIMMSLLTGMRIGEICAIKRKAVNMRTHVISVHETAQRIKIHDKTQLMVTAPKSLSLIHI